MHRLIAFFMLLAIITLASTAFGQSLIGNMPFDPRGCVDGQIQKYDATNKKFACQSESGGGNALAGHQHGVGTYAASAHLGTAVDAHSALTHTGAAVDAHTVGAKAGTSGGNVSFTAPVTHTVTQPAQHASQTHTVTQPSAHTLSGSSESVGAGTPSGTVSQPTFTGAQGDNRSAYLRVIFCRKT